jgi:hypothetical protein
MCSLSRCLASNGEAYLTEPLPCNDGKDRHTLKEGIYEVRRCHELSSQDMNTKFNRNRFRGSKDDKGNTKIRRQDGG